jgi:hypothetical protein
MVKNGILVLLMLWISFQLSAQDVKISATVEQGKAEENKPITGLLSITHEESATIDETSFRLDHQPLKVEFVQEVKMSTGPVLVTFFHFTLPPQKKGLYAIPEISVKVGGKEYTSVSSTYVVEEAVQEKEVRQPSRPAVERSRSPTESSSPTQLSLEAFVQDPTLYPGQRTRVGYRYRYTNMIELTQEKLPLLEAQGLLKIGTQQAQDTTEGEASVREVVQEVEAIKPGEWTYGPSLAEGYAYRLDEQGQKIYLKPMITSEAPPVTLTVKPFPEANKPASFNGAIGSFTGIQVGLTSPPSVFVGDEMNLKIEITGRGGPIENVPLPELCCQPGFSGLFKPSDLPPAEEVKKDSKIFKVELRPLSAQIKAIPSLEFAYFDPSTQSYQVLHSQPIPITVSLPPQPVKAEKTERPAEKIPLNTAVKPIEIVGVQPLDISDLFNKPFGTWKVFWILPLGILLILIQLNLNKIRRQHQMIPKTKDSAQLFEEALHLGQDNPDFYRLLNQAFLTRLMERGEITSTDIPLEALPQTGASAMVREFLLGIEQKRFSGQSIRLDPAFMETVRALFNQM